MSMRRKPNPNRNFPTHCPYCASTQLFPDTEGEFAWSCAECLRVFSVMFHGQNDAENAPAPAPSTDEALANSLARRHVTLPVSSQPVTLPVSSQPVGLPVSSQPVGLAGHGEFRDPAISPTPAAEPKALAVDIAKRNRELVDEHAESLYNASAEEIFTWTREHAPGPVVVTMSMENTVLAELANEYLPDADLLFLDTEYHFPETLEVADQVEQRYPNLTLIRAKAVLTRAEQDATYGPNLYRRDPSACCRMRKVEPLQQHLSPYAAVIDGLRRADGPTRAQAPALSLNKTQRLKISPIITWDLDDTERFITDHDLIVHPLTRQGYPSIGCATCTLPVAPGEDPRAGRWAQSTKTECGLHVDS